MILATLFQTSAIGEESGFCIHFIDVGQADAAVIICDGEVLMIDGGNTADSSLIYSYLTRTLGLDHIDYMIGTHAHEDHIGGLAGSLNACTVGKVYSPVTDYDSEAFQDFKRYAEEQVGSLTIPSVGDTFNVGSATVQFLSPAYQYADTNDTSIVVRIVYGNTSFLFTGDAEWESEHDMVNSGYDLSATLLKVGHHGSDTSTSYVFLREIMPQYAVISVGADNTYGHPTEDTISRLRDADVIVYRTDQQGDIICFSDGTELSFETEYGEPVDIESAEPENLGESVWNWGSQPSAEIDTPSNQTETVWNWGNPSADEAEDLEKEYTGEEPYVGNRNNHKLHYADCPSVTDIKEKNRVGFDSRDDAIAAGYTPCGACTP